MTGREIRSLLFTGSQAVTMLAGSGSDALEMVSVDEQKSAAPVKNVKNGDLHEVKKILAEEYYEKIEKFKPFGIAIENE